MIMRRLLVLVVVAALVCMCAKPVNRNINQFNLSVTLFNNKSNWNINIVIKSNCLVKYDDIKINKKNINIYFSCHKLNNSKIIIYNKCINLNKLKGKYIISIFINKIKKKEFAVNLD